MPRHPPCALTNLATKFDARVHCAVLKVRAGFRPGRRRVPGPRVERAPGRSVNRAGPGSPATPPPTGGAVRKAGGAETSDDVRSLRTQQRAEARAPSASAFRAGEPAVLTGAARRPANWSMFHPRAPSPKRSSEAWLWTTDPLRVAGRQVLLRKDVIQPHLPVRLPCYDFVPIADPTFDSSLLAVGPLASGVTNFRDVTGGVYKARERIHRSVADLRLLATPTSWGRVADPNPN